MSAVRKLPDLPTNKDLADIISDLHACLESYREKTLGDAVILSSQIKSVDDKVEILRKSNAALACSVDRLAKPFVGVDMNALVDQFTTIDRSVKWFKRAFVATIGIVVASIVGSAATLFFQTQFSHNETMNAVGSTQSAAHIGTHDGAARN